MKIISWNVNGLRAIYKKGFINWFLFQKPGILCVQETKAAENQLPEELKKIKEYHSYFTEAEKKGYSGAALWTRERPEKIETKLRIKRFDTEGRMIQADYPSFILFNVYFPNGKSSPERLQFKLDFYDTFLDYIDHLKSRGKKLIICGDFNTAHKEIDLARPKENENVSGFLLEERVWMDKLISHGFLDTFRLFEKGGGHYTWWDMKTRARERNVGWRIDYFFISKNLRKNIKSAFIQYEVMGSDHCPIGIEIGP